MNNIACNWPAIHSFSAHKDESFPTLINKKNQVVYIKSYGNFTIRCGHEPRESSGELKFIAWPIKAPLKYKNGLAVMCHDSTREKAITCIVNFLAGLDDASYKTTAEVAKEKVRQLKDAWG